MFSHRSALLATTAFFFAGSSALADPNVVVSIKPLHSLVAGVMEGVATPSVIVDGAASPHTYSLRPSKARDLQQADVIVWVGPGLEAFLERPVANIGAGASVVELEDAHDLVKLSVREGATFDAHDHGDHEGHADHDDHEKHDDHADHDDEKHDDHAKHDDHDDHDHAKHDDHDDDDHAKHEDHDDHDHAKHEDHDDHDHVKHEDHDDDDHAKHDDHDDHDHAKHADHDDEKHDDHAGHDDHEHGSFDPHFWLDPQNARVVVAEVAEALAKADPENASKYNENAARVTARLDALEANINTMVEPIKGQSFIVFHDAYQYFENRFGLQAAGSVTVSPEVAPGAERIAAIRDKVADLKVRCVFSEPQFSPSLVTVVTEQTDANASVLDPLGADLEPGPDLYFNLLQNLAKNVSECLTESS